MLEFHGMTEPAVPALTLPEPTREDYGFFGPGSAAWQVWTSPTSMIGFQRAVAIETFDPFLTAAVVDLNGVRANARGRFDRTGAYFLTIVLGDGPSAARASRSLMKFHERAVGIEPMSGRPYDANDPESQLWIHMTAWHSILKCYETFGAGKLDADRELEYWSQCAIAAEMQTCDPANVPRTREGVRAYFEAVRPRLGLSDQGSELFRYFLRPPVLSDARLLSQTFRTFSFAVVATMPRWMRRLGGVDQGRLVDAGAVATTKAMMRAASAGPASARVAAVRRLAPLTASRLDVALLGPPPRHQQTVTPTEARATLDRLES